MKILSLIKNLFFCILSGIILTLCFPKLDIDILAWVALVPFLFALDGKGKLQSFLLGYIFGLVFFAGTLYWFVYVHTAAVIAVVVYLALYPAVFGIFYSAFSKRPMLRKLLILSCAWITLDLIKDHLFTGFSWVDIGLTQYKNLNLIQIADITGVYGVTFIVVLFNLFFKELVLIFFKLRPSRLRRDYFRRQKSTDYSRDFVSDWTVLGPFILISIIFILFFSYGFRQFQHFNDYFLRKNHNKLVGVKLALVQADIPQDMKWDQSAWPVIFEKYFKLTRQAAEKKPDMIIWPETAFPGMIGEDDESLGKVKDFVRSIDIPLLFGAVTKENGNYYNSSVMINASGEIEKVYNKIHLVPFGEYVPYRSVFPKLAALVPIEDFTAGREYVNFSLPGHKGAKFSALICFEDTVASLVRKFTRGGSRLFINMTNDAWFMDTKAPYLHLQASVFRAIENRRYLVRCANTGVSAIVNPVGVIKYLKGASGGKTFVSGYLVDTVFFCGFPSFYMFFGDVFAYLCLIYFAIELLFFLMIIKK